MKKTIVILSLLLSWQSFKGYACYSSGIYFSDSDTTMVELVFGLSKPDHGKVSKKEWNQFMEEVITPRFPDGFTIIDASGHWKDSKQIIKEPSKILQVVCVIDAETDKKINEIAELYKKKFQQQAVLRIDSKVSYRL